MPSVYIQNSSVYSNSRYQWLKYLIDKVLADELVGDDIPEYLNRVLPIKEDSAKVEDNSSEAINSSPQSARSEMYNINQIKSILEITNIGLLDIKEPILFKPGLNVCYGKNGSGKKYNIQINKRRIKTYEKAMFLLPTMQPLLRHHKWLINKI